MGSHTPAWAEVEVDALPNRTKGQESSLMWPSPPKMLCTITEPAAPGYELGRLPEDLEKDFLKVVGRMGDLEKSD